MRTYLDQVNEEDETVYIERSNSRAAIDLLLEQCQLPPEFKDHRLGRVDTTNFIYVTRKEVKRQVKVMTFLSSIQLTKLS